MSAKINDLLADIRACRVCRDRPTGPRLAHEPRPVLRISATCRIGIFGQAPGTRVHASGVPFSDASGDRLRRWMGIDEDQFYDAKLIAIAPMGFCFPGLDAEGGDLPPRKECAPIWRDKVMEHLPNLETVLLVGRYAQAWHLADLQRPTLNETVTAWRTITQSTSRPQYWPLPHPSWRNNGWLKKNPWFEADLIPELQNTIRALIA